MATHNLVKRRRRYVTLSEPPIMHGAHVTDYNWLKFDDTR